jgi:flagellin
MTVINTNVGALMARTYATKASSRTETAMERLSSGLRINSAADDAAGMAVANKMNSQLKGIKMAVRNSQDGISLVQTAESGMSEITNMILRMRELAVQMENGIYTSKDRDNAQLEVNALLAEVDKIASNTRFNGVALLDGNYDQTIRAGNTNAETIRVRVDSLSTADAAKITGHAKNFVEVDTGGGATGVTSTGADTDLKVTMGQTNDSKVHIDTSLFSTAFKTAFKTDSLGVFTKTGAQASKFDIDSKTGKLTSNTAMAAGSNAVNVVYTPRTGSAHTEAITLVVTAATEKNLSEIKVETTEDASHAIEHLDKALAQMSNRQANLGALQNRMQYTINNLTRAAMNIEMARGRVIDADFSAETTALAKHQILSQAAQAMLAQANNSKQSVLSLLQ